MFGRVQVGRGVLRTDHASLTTPPGHGMFVIRRGLDLYEVCQFLGVSDSLWAHFIDPQTGGPLGGDRLFFLSRSGLPSATSAARKANQAPELEGRARLHSTPWALRGVGGLRDWRRTADPGFYDPAAGSVQRTGNEEHTQSRCGTAPIVSTDVWGVSFIVVSIVLSCLHVGINYTKRGRSKPQSLTFVFTLQRLLPPALLGKSTPYAMEASEKPTGFFAACVLVLALYCGNTPHLIISSKCRCALQSCAKLRWLPAITPLNKDDRKSLVPVSSLQRPPFGTPGPRRQACVSESHRDHISSIQSRAQCNPHGCSAVTKQLRVRPRSS